MPSALIMDWGGVLTGPLDAVTSRRTDENRIDAEHYRTVIQNWAGAEDSPVHALERGEITPEDFERALALQLRELGSAADPRGMVARMLADLQGLDQDMMAMLRRARDAGLRLALLSNSWGEHYPEHAWQGLFDAVVISGRIGMRKPEPRIFRHVAELLGLPPGACVMVDDLPLNVHAAVDAGMVGVLHESYRQTLLELEAIFDLPLH